MIIHILLIIHQFQENILKIADRIIKRFKFKKNKSIIEIGSNDGTF